MHVYIYKSLDHPDLHSFPTRRSSDLRRLRTSQVFAEREKTFPTLHVPIEGMIDPPQIVAMRLKRLRRACGFSTQTAFADRKSTRQLQSLRHLVCRLLLEKKNTHITIH